MRRIKDYFRVERQHRKIVCVGRMMRQHPNSTRRAVDLAKTRPQEFGLAKLSGCSAWASILFLTNAEALVQNRTRAIPQHGLETACIRRIEYAIYLSRCLAHRGELQMGFPFRHNIEIVLLSTGNFPMGTLHTMLLILIVTAKNSFEDSLPGSLRL